MKVWFKCNIFHLWKSCYCRLKSEEKNVKSLRENTTGLCIIHSLTQTQSLSLYYTTLSPYTFWTSGDLDDGDRMKLSSDNYLWSIHIWFKSQNGVFSLGWVDDFFDFVHENGTAPSYLHHHLSIPEFYHTGGNGKWWV